MWGVCLGWIVDGMLIVERARERGGMDLSGGFCIEGMDFECAPAVPDLIP